MTCDCGFSAEACAINPCMRKKVHLAGLTPDSKWPNTGRHAEEQTGRHCPPGHVLMPCSIEEARGMYLVAENYLKSNDPEFRSPAVMEAIANLGVQEVADAWAMLERHGFPPEAVNWPEENIAGKLPIAIDNAITALTGARDDLLAEVLKLRGSSQPETAWQPIETAPRDGTRILVCTKNRFPKNSYVARWLKDGWKVGPMSDWDAYPDHWMPIPSLPSTDLRGGDK